MSDAYFMRKALEQATAALNSREFPVGCVIADERRVIATGARTKSTGAGANELDHAEINALRELQASGFSEDRARLTLYSTMEPCLMCFGAIILNNITRIVYAYEDVMGGGTKCRLSELPPLYAGANIKIVAHILRQESLSLFKSFFSDAGQAYWGDSLLAQYTLSQD